MADDGVGTGGAPAAPSSGRRPAADPVQRSLAPAPPSSPTPEQVRNLAAAVFDRAFRDLAGRKIYGNNGDIDGAPPEDFFYIHDGAHWAEALDLHPETVHAAARHIENGGAIPPLTPSRRREKGRAPCRN